MNKNVKKKVSIILCFVAVIAIFAYFYTVYKSINMQYILQSAIFSGAAVFFIRSYLNDAIEWNKSILVAFVIAMIARTFIVQAFKIPTGSMEPTLHGDPLNGDRVLVNKFIYNFKKPARGNIVVFRTVNIPGLDGQKDFIKRLAALPREKVEIRNDKLYIDSKKVGDPEIFEIIEYINTRRFSRGLFGEGQYGMPYTPILVPENNFYVLGDNSRVSRDSRFWGFVPEENLMGQAFMIYWPFKRIKLLKDK